MANSDSAKGNPASKRMGNERRKQRRAKSWTRGQQRKDARRKAQQEREAANREHPTLTPGALKTADRVARNLAGPTKKAKPQVFVPQSYERTEANIRRIMRDSAARRERERAARQAA